MKNILISICITICLAFNLKAQDKADYFYKAGYYNEAITVYEKQMSKGRLEEQSARKQLADSYFHMHGFNKSLELYENLYSEGNRDSLTLYRLAELSRLFCDYENAKKYYASFKDKSTEIHGEKLNDILADRIDFPSENKEVNKAISLEQIKLPQFNMGMGYAYFKDGNLIAGIEKEDEETKTSFTTLGVFSSSSDFQELAEFELNSETPFFNAYPSFSEEQGELFFTANRIGKKKSFKGGVNVLNIFMFNTMKKDQEPMLLPFNSHHYNYTHPSISKDGNTLYFVSDKPGGYGGFDVYYVTKTEGGWSEMINCGKEVNTAFDELTPFISGDSLFFSSYGHENYGGSDVFVSISESEIFTNVSNMGMPINSCMNDFSFIYNPNNGKGLLTSDRNAKDSQNDDVFVVNIPKTLNLVSSEKGGDPIADVSVMINKDEEIITDENGEWVKNIAPGEEISISFDNPYYETKVLKFKEVTEQQIEQIKKVKLAPVIISGQAIDDITGNPLDGVKVELYEKTGPDEWKLIETKDSDVNGKWEFHVRKDREYKVTFEKDDYISHNEIVPRYNDDESKEMRNEVISRMNPYSMKYEAKKDLVIQIDNIYFDLNSSLIQEESFPVLDKLKQFLTENPDVKVELSAHTDCLGESKYNLWLSDRRAASAKKHLVERGISSNRITAKGYGEEKMIVTDCELQKRDDSEAQKNRRVEVKIL